MLVVFVWFIMFQYIISPINYICPRYKFCQFYNRKKIITQTISSTPKDDAPFLHQQKNDRKYMYPMFVAHIFWLNVQIIQFVPTLQFIVFKKVCEPESCKFTFRCCCRACFLKLDKYCQSTNAGIIVNTDLHLLPTTCFNADDPN